MTMTSYSFMVTPQHRHRKNLKGPSVSTGFHPHDPLSVSPGARPPKCQRRGRSSSYENVDAGLGTAAVTGRGRTYSSLVRTLSDYTLKRNRYFHRNFRRLLK